ncbi:hypothetical protein RRG08_015607 [Elysia crispata]|uniref:Uncharacterized protein n=1 Tax=Elysia crispata TaxID=231223 RepID=A0AAE1CZE4_9GAST|nr:hypothetical protein RRG08_015607 [Elysia crispata]
MYPNQIFFAPTVPYFHMPDDDEAENEMKRLAMMSPEQKVYMRSCDHYKVRPLRQILKQIDSKEIVLAHTKMRDMEFKAFTTSLIMNFTVKRLDLSDTLPTERQTTYLNDFLEDDNGITDLILKDNKLEGRMVARMFDSMRRRDVMIYLDISGNNLRDKDLPVLAAYIETSSQLSFLHMANNKFTSKAGEPLGKMMAQAALVELNISCNRLRGDGMAAFLTAIAKSNSLERLDVSWNGIGPEAVRGLCTLLRQSTSIVSLDLTATSINGECLELICTQGLSKNGVLQRLELKNNPLLTQDLTTFLTRLYSYQTIAIRRVDLGDYQMLDSSVEHLLEALFWERQIYIRSAGTFAYSGRSDTLENIVQRFKKDSLSLVTRLDHGQRTALVKHFAQVDMQEAVEMGSDIISNSFLGRANDNKVTYKDLALRINMERKNPRDVINSILEKQEVPEHTKKWVSRFSSTPEEIRKTQLLTRDS